MDVHLKNLWLSQAGNWYNKILPKKLKDLKHSSIGTLGDS